MTCPRVDMNFTFECSTRYLTSERNTSEKGTIYFVTITTVISPRVKMTCYFHVWRYEVFARKLTWYFIGDYIIKSNMFLNCIKYMLWRVAISFHYLDARIKASNFFLMSVTCPKRISLGDNVWYFIGKSRRRRLQRILDRIGLLGQVSS